MTDEQIKAELLRAGWSATDVEAVLPPSDPVPPIPALQTMFQQAAQAATAMPQPQMPVKRRSHAGFWITVIILLLAGGAAYYFLPQLTTLYDKYFGASESTNLLPYTPPVTDVNSENPAIPNPTEATSTEGWKTYTNDKYGFEFQYPADMNIIPVEEGQVNLANQKQPPPVATEPPSPLMLFFEESSSNSLEWASKRLQKFGGVREVTYLEKNLPLFKGVNGVLTFELVDEITEKPGYAFSKNGVNYAFLSGISGNTKLVKILSTFKFVSSTTSVTDSQAIQELVTTQLSELRAVTSFQQAEAIALKYGTSAYIQKIKSQQQQIDSLPDSFKESMVKTFVSSLPNSSFQFTSVNISGDGATAIISDGKTTGTITLKKESGLWKIDNEAYKETAN